MAGRQVGGTGDCEGRSRQHCLDRYAGPEFFQGAVEDFAAWGVFDELDQWLYMFWVLDTGMHGELSFVVYLWFSGFSLWF